MDPNVLEALASLSASDLTITVVDTKPGTAASVSSELAAVAAAQEESSAESGTTAASVLMDSHAHFVRRSCNTLDNAGVVHLAGTVMPLELLPVLQKAAHDVTASTLALLDSKGIEYQAQTEPWAYAEVASRCPGRLDIRIDGVPPFNDQQLVGSDSKWASVARAALSNGGGGGGGGGGMGLNEDVDGGAVLAYTGLVVSLPGAVDQTWHTDGEALYPDMQLPPHALTVFLPLDDLCGATGSALGSPEFLPASHLVERRKELDTGTGTPPMSASFGLKAGEAVIFDYRTVHRGVKNRSTETARPLLYQVWTKPWFRDVRNFGLESLSL